MADKQQLKTASFGRLVMIFSGILFLFLSLSANQTSSKLQREHQRQLLKQLETSLDPVIMQTSDVSYVFNLFQNLIESAGKYGAESTELEKAVEECNTRYLTPVKAFIYKQNQLVKSFAATTEDLELFSPLLQGMALKGPEFDKIQRELHQRLLNGFGPGHRLELMKLGKGAIKRFKFGEKDRFYYWNEYSDGLGVFLIATHIPDFMQRFAATAPDKTRFGAGDPANKSWIAPEGLTEDQTAAARIKASLTGQNNTTAFGYLWYFIDDESGVFWCRVSEESAIEKARPAWAQNIFIFSSLLALLAIYLYLTACTSLWPGTRLCRWLDSLSIKYRILGLFSMASVFPVIFTILIGATSLSDRAEIIENSVISESIAAIDPLEKMYTIRLSQTFAAAKKLRHLLINTPASEELFSRILHQFHLPRDLARLEVRDGAGVTLFSTDDRQVHGVAEAMDIFSRIALKLHAPGRMGQAANRITPGEIVSESIMSTDEMGMATIMRQRGQPWLFRMGTFPTTWYWDVYPEIATGPAFMCMTTQMENTYKTQIEEKLGAQNPDSYQLDLATEMNYHFCKFNLFPDLKNIDQKTLLNAAMASFRTGRVVFRESQIAGRRYWVTIKPEKNITTQVFFHMISQPERLQTLTPLKWQLATGGILALMVSLLGALLITRLIILPVTDLGNGIKAIRDRQIDFRTPVRRHDEFGKLATAFNNVIGELKELEYGRVVQESLLPREPIIPEGYDIAFFNTSATDLAGDYHDVVLLNDGRLALILGDVTGHGISAALAMAMAKATVNYMGMDGSLFPVTLMDKLNALFNKELKPRHKFMTLVTIVLDPATGKVEIDNAGQSYPRFFSMETSTSTEIDLPSMPLGAMKKRKPRVEVRHMKSGDAFILYSDGIIECADLTGDMYGYDRFYASYENLMRKRTPAAEALRLMMAELDAFRQPGPYPDDVTLVLLRKL